MSKGIKGEIVFCGHTDTGHDTDSLKDLAHITNPIRSRKVTGCIDIDSIIDEKGSRRIGLHDTHILVVGVEHAKSADNVGREVARNGERICRGKNGKSILIDGEKDISAIYEYGGSIELSSYVEAGIIGIDVEHFCVEDIGARILTNIWCIRNRINVSDFPGISCGVIR